MYVRGGRVFPYGGMGGTPPIWKFFASPPHVPPTKFQTIFLKSHFYDFKHILNESPWSKKPEKHHFTPLSSGFRLQNNDFLKFGEKSPPPIRRGLGKTLGLVAKNGQKSTFLGITSKHYIGFR